MILKWFDCSASDEFARSLAAEICEVFDPTTQRSANLRKLQARVPLKLEKILARATAFQSGHRLNLYRKARLLNTLKWELKERQYAASFIDDIVDMVAKRIS